MAFNSWVWTMAYDDFRTGTNISLNNRDLLANETSGTQAYRDDVVFEDGGDGDIDASGTTDTVTIGGSTFDIESMGAWGGSISWSDPVSGASGAINIDGNMLGDRLYIFNYKDGSTEKFAFRWSDGVSDRLVADMLANGVDSSTDPMALVTGVFSANANPGANLGSLQSSEFASDTVALCFARGTMLRSKSGSIAVEDLKPGMHLLTNSGSLEPILWIGRTYLGPEQIWYNRPVRIPAGALGINIPERDLIVSQQHRIIVNNKIVPIISGESSAFIPAKKLIGYNGIDYCHEVREVEYFHVLLPYHFILISEGAETESFFPGRYAMKAVSEVNGKHIIHRMKENGLDFSDYTMAKPEIRRDIDVKRFLSLSEGKHLYVKSRETDMGFASMDQCYHM